MTTWWHVGKYGKAPEPFEVVKETAQRVAYERTAFSGKPQILWVKKWSEYHNYFASYNEARDYIIERAKMKLESAKSTLASCEEELEAALALPESAP